MDKPSITQVRTLCALIEDEIRAAPTRAKLIRVLNSGTRALRWMAEDAK